MDVSTLWELLKENQEKVFHTYSGLEFQYEIRGNEVFFSRKKKSVTRATIERAYEKAGELNYVVTGPKKLQVFGASYVYPVFLALGIIEGAENGKKRQ